LLRSLLQWVPTGSSAAAKEARHQKQQAREVGLFDPTKTSKAGKRQKKCKGGEVDALVWLATKGRKSIYGEAKETFENME